MTGALIVTRKNNLIEVPQLCPECHVDRHALAEMLSEPRETINGKRVNSENRQYAINIVESCTACKRWLKGMI